MACGDHSPGCSQAQKAAKRQARTTNSGRRGQSEIVCTMAKLARWPPLPCLPDCISRADAKRCQAAHSHIRIRQGTAHHASFERAWQDPSKVHHSIARSLRSMQRGMAWHGMYLLSAMAGCSWCLQQIRVHHAFVLQAALASTLLY
ncbi:hypothetical protein M441DRAFT_372555 [Trichoderma asperellum CBS 433.97]|uniref:Uncharacterized protein n=1 Tax=Trichoderma asperellum (strain ATCC 204424 / CBS 433.97 / NBRC 101777) TaxID=1042311 RepID=A0A2T3ZF57_TRIA4|nr:hypothetical protein M441DRAFT_372555 [Trichoderma asperellum CBS 433.97]PTB43441.1 hypothetical protein M441DRAFT_372555 [Trichoderma asperellum CBS 433.97]